MSPAIKKIETFLKCFETARRKDDRAHDRDQGSFGIEDCYPNDPWLPVGVIYEPVATAQMCMAALPLKIFVPTYGNVIDATVLDESIGTVVA